MKQESAETIALQALAFLIGDDDLRDVFMGATGASAEDMRIRAGDPEFLISVLDFLMMDDAWVVRFCDANGFDYTTPQTARQSLPGGAQVHWT
ncbi:DUF3572 domain-containing protein [Cognatishimia sp. MH4019]|uniref:DUF3572 domain-containing protein n=1 Tax=Cognatishimia sp. MH4019 TaxID=2854030 RepID=UPI001CD2E8C7|nr:DUF3572 domain-containing protein [Cognatishimia sp. MH4019]